MKNSKKARNYKSELITNLFQQISPLEMQQSKEKMLLAARIHDLMIQKGIRRVELAKRLNKRPSEITKWLSGTQNITMDILTMISFELKVSLSDLFSNKQNKLESEIQYVHTVYIQVPSFSPKVDFPNANYFSLYNYNNSTLH